MAHAIPTRTPHPPSSQAALERIQSVGSVYGSPTHGRTLSQCSYGSADTAEDVPDRISLNSSPVSDTTSSAISGRPPTPSHSAVSAVAAAASAVKTAVVAPVVAVASAVVPGGGGGGAASRSATGSADDIRGRRQDWKLDAQELSLIRKEEERVMKPDVLARLLAKGAGLGCEPWLDATRACIRSSVFFPSFTTTGGTDHTVFLRN